MIKVQFLAPGSYWPEYQKYLSAAFDAADLSIDLRREHAPEVVDYIVFAPSGAEMDFGRYLNTKAVLSLWVGVEAIAPNKTLTMPLTRMVDPGLTEGMVEWVTGHVLRHHLNIDFALAHQNGEWIRHVPPLARLRTVGILGLGELGAACAQALARLNFDVMGWSRRQKLIDGVTCFSGSDGLDMVLKRAEIIVLLLPLTKATRHVLSHEAFGKLPKGAVVINPGRGPLIEDRALLEALESGRVSHATLDVFHKEPLDPGHPFWGHPQVTVTPHIASETRAVTATQVIAENIRRCEAGEGLLYLVDRETGY